MIFKLNFSLILIILLIFLYSTLVESVPEDYCLSPLNTSDCGRPPIPVFYYYKSGSRCEIKFWRGCPTGNLFNTEYHCSHHCIGRLWSSEQDAKVESFSKTSLVDTLTGLKYKCDIPIDTSQCKQAKQFVYTYDIKKKKCIKVTYYGCPTENKFRDEEECQDICEKSEDQWEHAVKEMDLDELRKLNNLLDNVKDEFETEKENLKKDVKKSKIVPHTVPDDGVTELPEDETNKIDNESKEPTEKPEKPTDEPVAPTDKTTITTTEEESETKAETKPAVATTNSVHEKGTEAEETTKLPVSTKRTRRKRVTKNSHDEGDVVREGVNYNYQ
ncbi:uncharacterized protein [Choristoneura fumiferana]|uniref:uncharacterized protein n=1 Tax=Choristoneura fumiferana TaxID=7141 RepID=UPI003D155FA6